MATFELEHGGKSYEVDAPDQAAALAALPQIESGGTAKEKPTAGKLERLGTGFMDPVYGAEQIADKYLLQGLPKAEQAERSGATDKFVQEREKGIQERRPAADRNSTDWLRVGGSIPSTMALTAPAMLAGGIPGAMVAGATGAAIQPTTDTEHFGTEKAESLVEGGVLGGVIGAGAKALGAGVKAFGSYIAREYPENVMTQAVTKILKRMGQDERSGGPSAQHSLELINEASRAGKPMALADVGGENTAALAGNVARQPGEGRNVAKNFLTERDRGAPARLAADINQYVHGGESMHRTTGALLEARSAAGRPAWDAVRSMEGVWSPRLQQFIEDPALRSGMARGYEIERLESLAENRPFDPTQMGINLDNEGNIQIISAPNMRVLHMGKMGLDAMIGAERNEITGRLSQRGVALDRVRRAYLQEIDGLDQQGVYRNARALWEGPSASMDAIRTGRGIFTTAPEEVAAEFGAMSPANQEFYRIGVADMLRERLMKTGLSGDEAKAIVKNPWMRAQLEPIFRSPEDLEGFFKAVTDEGQMFQTKFNTIGGSQSGARLAEDASSENAMAAHGMHMGAQMAGQHWLGAAKSAIRMWRDRQDRRGNEALNEQIAKIIFQPGIEADSEIGQRLTGQYTGPPDVNRLAGAGDIAAKSSQVLAPGGGSALAQPQQ
jgi:hypothetical protein